MDSQVYPYDSLRPEEIGRRPPGYQAPAGLRLGTVTLQVADLDRSLAFYRDLLGLQVLSERLESDRRLVDLGAPANREPLVRLHERPGVRPARDRGRLGLYHFAILLPDRPSLARFLIHAASSGAQFGQADHFFSEALYLTDPDGLEVEVYRDRPRSDWRVTTEGQLIGTTEPLDVRSLAATAGGVPWRGVPEGTVIGHMHFYVGDLERAERFYHDGLGLTTVLWSFPSALFMSAGGYHHHVGVNTWAVGARPSAEDDARLLNWEYVVPTQEDRRAVASSLERAGFATNSEGDSLLASDDWGINVRIRAGS